MIHKQQFIKKTSIIFFKKILGGVGAVTTPAAITASAIALSMIGTPTLTAPVINGNDRFCGAALGGDITIGASVISESVCTGNSSYQQIRSRGFDMKMHGK